MVIESITPVRIVLNDGMPGVNRSFIGAVCFLGIPVLIGFLIDRHFTLSMLVASAVGFGLIFLIAWISAKYFLGASATYTFDGAAGELRVRRRTSVSRLCALSDIMAVAGEISCGIGSSPPRRLFLRLADGSFIPVAAVYSADDRNESERARDAVV